MTMNFGGAIKFNTNAIFTIISLLFCILVFYHHNSSKKDSKLVDLKDLLGASIDAAIRGGKKVYDIRINSLLHEESKGKTKEGANNPITDGDVQSHMEMYYSIQKAFPYITIVSEEKDGNKQNDLGVDIANINPKERDFVKLESELVNPSDVFVWIDPLDATQEYTENLREYVTTMVCVAVKGVPVIGVIHKPFEDETYWTWLNHGYSIPSSLNLQNRGSFPAHKGLKVIVSRSHKGEVEKFAKHALGEDSIITPAGGAGFKVTEVLKQHQDVYIHVTLIKKWDICAGNAILNYFNGSMTTLKGDAISYGEIGDYKNNGGLIASLTDSDYYVGKFRLFNDVAT